MIRFGEVLERRAREFQHTPQIGRTHGIHAEPITFGLKIANWFAENRRNLERFGQAARQMAVGKISGAVGNASHLGPEVEAAICERLGLDVAPVSVAGDRSATATRSIVSTLAIVTATLEKIALGNPPPAAHRSARGRGAVRRRAARQLGDAAQAQSGFAANRFAVWRAWCAPMLGAALENIALWHERDISHSSVERVILPDSTILADYMLARMTEIVAGMRVFPERMRRNLDATGGLVFSGQLLQDLVEAGAAARGRLQMGAGTRHGGVGSGPACAGGDEFSRAGQPGFAHRRLSELRRARKNVRSCSAVAFGGFHLRSRLRTKHSPTNHLTPG